MMAAKTAGIFFLSDLTPPSIERIWLTAPHPRIPIVAACSSDKTVRIYSLTNFRLLSTVSGGHKRSVRTCAWKPHVQGESVLATGSFDATVGIWRRWDNYGNGDSADGTWDIDGSANEVRDADSSLPDRGCDRDDDEEEWRFAVLLDGHDSEVKSVSWSPSGMLLATCSRDKSIWIWEDLDDGDNNFETVAVMQEHGGDVKCVAWHPVEECLASGSYDDTIRLWREDIDDWTQVACIKGHEGTVWSVDWEAVDNVPSSSLPGLFNGSTSSAVSRWKEQNAVSGPRLISSSDDRTIRVWRRQPKDQQRYNTSNMPSILRPTGIEESWEEEAILPRVHDLSIYTVAWSKRTGLVASVGADGRIVIYEEQIMPTTTISSRNDQEEAMQEDKEAGAEAEAMEMDSPAQRTKWSIIASLQGAHGVYEINHVAWARRADRGRRQDKEEEVLVTTGDDGSVKVWGIGHGR